MFGQIRILISIDKYPNSVFYCLLIEASLTEIFSCLFLNFYLFAYLTLVISLTDILVSVDWVVLLLLCKYD